MSDVPTCVSYPQEEPEEIGGITSTDSLKGVSGWSLTSDDSAFFTTCTTSNTLGGANITWN